MNTNILQHTRFTYALFHIVQYKFGLFARIRADSYCVLKSGQHIQFEIISCGIYCEATINCTEKLRKLFGNTFRGATIESDNICVMVEYFSECRNHRQWMHPKLEWNAFRNIS